VLAVAAARHHSSHRVGDAAGATSPIWECLTRRPSQGRLSYLGPSTCAATLADVSPAVRQQRQHSAEGADRVSRCSPPAIDTSTLRSWAAQRRRRSPGVEPHRPGSNVPPSTGRLRTVARAVPPSTARYRPSGRGGTPCRLSTTNAVPKAGLHSRRAPTGPGRIVADAQNYNPASSSSAPRTVNPPLSPRTGLHWDRASREAGGHCSPRTTRGVVRLGPPGCLLNTARTMPVADKSMYLTRGPATATVQLGQDRDAGHLGWDLSPFPTQVLGCSSCRPTRGPAAANNALRADNWSSSQHLPGWPGRAIPALLTAPGQVITTSRARPATCRPGSPVGAPPRCIPQ